MRHSAELKTHNTALSYIGLNLIVFITLFQLPRYKNFRGSIMQLIDNKYVVNGEIAVVDNGTLEITELPVKKWTQDYKEDVLEPMLTSTEKTPALIT